MNKKVDSESEIGKNVNCEINKQDLKNFDNLNGKNENHYFEIENNKNTERYVQTLPSARNTE